MPGKWKSPLLNWEENNQDPNLAFTLVARNEAARQMWADPCNSPRYAPASFTKERTRNKSLGENVSRQRCSENNDENLRTEQRNDTEPALRFLFNFWPKDFAKGYVLGSSEKLCDALLGDSGDCISEQTLAFTFNERHELIMNVISDDPTWVKYSGQKGAELGRSKWIIPQGQKPISVKITRILEFDIVLPTYGINKRMYDQNCESFLSSAAVGALLPDSLAVDSTAVSQPPSGPSGPQKSFYLRGKVLGSGSYGDVHKVLRMPDGKFCAAKRFRDTESFSQEVKMLKKVCKTPHINIIQFVEEWHGDYKPLLIMEYVPGGNLAQQMSHGMGLGETANLANQALTALVFLHDQGVMHRDIKPANILCVTPDHYKLADFGVSREVAPSLSRQGTAEYNAPEVYDLAPYSFPADIWSLGVVLLECMDGLPDGHPGTLGRKWYEEVLSNLLAYYQRCKKRGGDALKLPRFVTISMLRMDADERLSARRCLESCQHLWESLAHTEDWEARRGEKTLVKAHPNESFPPHTLDNSDGDETGAETSNTVRWDGGGLSETGREPLEFRNEDRAAVTGHGKAGESFLGSLSSLSSVGKGELYDPSNILPWPLSIGGGTLYDPTNVVPWPASISGGTLYDPSRAISSVPSTFKTEMHAHSISDTRQKSRRDGDDSVEGIEEDGSVTPGRRAPYHPGNEVAAPGLGYLPPSPWVSSPKPFRSATSEPSRKQPRRAARRSARES